MTSDHYFKMMQEQVFLSIIEGFSNAPKLVRVGARPHTGKNVVDRLKAIIASLTLRITVVTQPAHNPDMNVIVNDLGRFPALDVRV
jgi:hypothetical protein